MISVSEAQELVKQHAFLLKTDVVPLKDTLGMVLGEEVRADRDYPPFNRSAMDGFAVNTSEFREVKEFIVADTLFAGDFRERSYAKGEVVKIMTGAPVPHSFNAVVKVEDSERVGDKVKFTVKEVRPYENIARRGEDLQQGATALPAGVKVTPAEMVLLASLGKSMVKVYENPKVSIISTGDEIKAVGESVLPHQIRNSNGPVLEAFFKKFGIDKVEESIVDDDPAHLQSALEKAMDSDIVVLSGGVSMGEADHVPGTLRRLGVEKIFHKAKLKPGKPLWFGKKPDGPVVFGLPGNPFSCQVTFKVFIEPFLRASFGMQPVEPLFVPAAFDREKKIDLDEFLPAVIVREQGVSKINLCKFNGSGDITATALSDGLVVHLPKASSIKKGDIVPFYSW